MLSSAVPAEYAGLPDPGDEGQYRHATRPEPYQSAKASVYRFGVHWHWKCGPAGPPGRCLGGRASSQAEAWAAAGAHVRDEHLREMRSHDGPNCWCGDRW